MSKPSPRQWVAILVVGLAIASLLLLVLCYPRPKPNQAPVANSDDVTGMPEKSLTIAVLGNDSDADGDELKIDSVPEPATVSTTHDGVVIALAPYDSCGEDKLKYKITDSRGGFALADVKIHIACPTAVELAESNFDFGAHSPTGEGKRILAAFVAQLSNATGRVSIVGHTCEIGPEKMNITLSLRRATEVSETLKTLLKEQKVRNVTLDPPRGVGEGDPKDGVNCDRLKNDPKKFEEYKACLSPNRRVVVQFHPRE